MIKCVNRLHDSCIHMFIQTVQYKSFLKMFSAEYHMHGSKDPSLPTPCKMMNCPKKHFLNFPCPFGHKP
ncbi:hypothetical protein Hanom_Chr16g01472251 [Helianthus anomalus]